MLVPFLVLGAAWATSNFPPTLETDHGVPCQPPCTLCHDGAPGSGTATTAFALAMKDRGLVPNDTASLATALDSLAADGVDSDGDGSGDVDELAVGTDPNGGPDLCSVLTPSYGCLDTSRGIPSWPLVALALLALAVRRIPGPWRLSAGVGRGRG